jgi:amphi-Trp domain-containing protein
MDNIYRNQLAVPVLLCERTRRIQKSPYPNMVMWRINPETEGANMDLLEISEKRKMGREEVAQLLHHLADSLARHNAVDFVQNGIKLNIKVPDEVTVELEVEVESDESSIEVELSW